MPRGKKQSEKTEPEEVSDNQFIEDGSEEEMEQPTVTNWASEFSQPVSSSRPSRDILKITSDEATTLGTQTVDDTSINDLLRVLIRRGYDNSNPALAKGAERLLLQLNCIPLRAPSNGRRRNNGGRSGGYRRRGGFRRDGPRARQEGRGSRDGQDTQKSGSAEVN